MNAKILAAGLTLFAGLGAAVPAHADSLQIGVGGRRFGFGITIGRPACIEPAPVYYAPIPAYVAPAPVVVESPVVVTGGYYGWEGGHRVFYRGHGGRFRR